MSSSPNLYLSWSQLRTLNREQLLNVVSKLALPAVMTLIVIGIAWQLAQLTWLLFEPKATATPVPVIATAVPQNANHSFSVQTISDAHLFGIASAQPSETEPSNLPQTQVALVLAGTIAFADPQAGYAIVGENVASTKFYKVGAMINDSVRLHSVYTDRVIIDRAGVLETLSLPHAVTSGMPMVTRPLVNANPGAQLSDNIRRIVSNNPSALSQMLRVQPVFSNGSQKGYRVYPGRDRAQFARLGLQPGDLITSINGMLLNDPAASNDVLGLLSSSTSVTVGIERNGATMQLNLDISQIVLPEDNAESPGEGSALRNERMPRTPPPSPINPSAQ